MPSLVRFTKRYAGPLGIFQVDAEVYLDPGTAEMLEEADVVEILEAGEESEEAEDESGGSEPNPPPGENPPTATDSPPSKAAARRRRKPRRESTS